VGLLKSDIYQHGTQGRWANTGSSLTACPENEGSMMFRNVHKTLLHELGSVREDLNVLITESLNKEEVIN
jgi:hypothetical protein